LEALVHGRPFTENWIRTIPSCLGDHVMKRYVTLAALICTLACLAANAAASPVTITFDEAGLPTGTLMNNSDFDVAGYHFNFWLSSRFRECFPAW
jgi:hypothetical protein